MTIMRLLPFIIAALLPLTAVAQKVQPDSQRRVTPYVIRHYQDAKAHKAAAGIIIVEDGNQTRSLMPYNGTMSYGIPYAEIANTYKRKMPNVNIYCMIVPTAVEFYCPPMASTWTKKQHPVINNTYAHVSDSVYVVDAYTNISRHTDENIYSRTDHHWAPLGAFYAAEALARTAGVPFRQLNDGYEECVVRRYVGSMYYFSKDIAVKNSPEDFVYHKPTDVEYTTTYITYKTENRKIIGEYAPQQGTFFKTYKDGSGGAYCTFMGGDSKITIVRTGTKNGRRLVIFKDSFGNAIPGYLFYSFEEIHVVDGRYFNKNIIKYVKENKITDLVFANNATHANSSSFINAYKRFLVQ